MYIGNKALIAALNDLDYSSSEQLSLLTRLFSILGSLENFSGLKKKGIIKLCLTIFTTYGLLDELLEALRKRVIRDVNPLSWFISVCISHGEADKRSDPIVTSLIKVLLKQSNEASKKYLENLFIGGNSTLAWTVEDFRLAEPLHSNDHPDDYRKIDIFPTREELQVDTPVYRGWSGDAEAIHTQLLDRQFRYMREDLIAPLKDDLTKLHENEKYFLRNPHINSLMAAEKKFGPSFSISFMVPEFLLTQFSHNAKKISAYLSDDGSQVYPAESVVLFFCAAADNSTKDELVHIGTITCLHPEVHQPIEEKNWRAKSNHALTFTMNIAFAEESTRELLTLLCGDRQSKQFCSYAIVSKVSFFAYEPILKCLQGMLLLDT